MIAGQDPAVQAVIRASTWRLQQAVTAAINGEIRAMIAEGHDDGVVAIASCNAAAALVGVSAMAESVGSSKLPPSLKMRISTFPIAATSVSPDPKAISRGAYRDAS